MLSLGGCLQEVVAYESLDLLGQDFTSLTYSNFKTLLSNFCCIIFQVVKGGSVAEWFRALVL